MGYWTGLYNTELYDNIAKYNCSIDGAWDVYGTNISMCTDLIS